MFQASQVELQTSNKLLHRAPAVFPELLFIGKCFEDISNDSVQKMSKQVIESVGAESKIDSRLATQYALTILCVQMLDCLYNYATLYKQILVFYWYAQLIITSKLKGTCADSAWEYFTDVIAPEVLQWQGSHNHPEKSKSLGDLVFNLV